MKQPQNGRTYLISTPFWSMLSDSGRGNFFFHPERVVGESMILQPYTVMIQGRVAIIIEMAFDMAIIQNCRGACLLCFWLELAQFAAAFPRFNGIAPGAAKQSFADSLDETPKTTRATIWFTIK